MRRPSTPARDTRAPVGGPPAGTGNAPGQGSTRERILDIALELFSDHGYEKTSLRDIAQRLGTTKAALYYHFERKEDILLELHLRLHAVGRKALDRLEELPDGEARADAWPRLLDELIDQMLEHRELVRLHMRNQSAFEQILSDPRNRSENEDIEQQFRRVLRSPDIPVQRRVRMVCSVGVVVSALSSGDTVFSDVPTAELAEHVRAAAHDALGGPGTAT